MEKIYKDKNYWKNKESIRSKQTLWKTSLQARYNSLLRYAASKNIECTLTFSEYELLVGPGVCHYHGGSLYLHYGTGYLIDRLDPKRGYIFDNCVPCCKTCNDIKGHDISAQDAYVMIRKLVEINPTRFNKEQYTYKEVVPKTEPAEVTEPADMKLLLDRETETLIKSINDLEIQFANGVRIFQQPFDKFYVNHSQIWKKKYPDCLIFRTNEILQKTDIIKSIIRHKVQLSEHKIHARECQIVNVPTSVANTFFNQNHIKGKNPSPTIGLEYNNELVAALAYKFTKGCVLELNRVAFRNGYSIPGAFSKLLSYALGLTQPIAVTSFVDLRYHSGLGYEATGFIKLGTSQGWNWTNGSNTFNRLTCRANMDHRNLSEADHASELGWWKMYDAGQAKYTKYFNKPEDLPEKIEKEPPKVIENKIEAYYENERRKSYQKCIDSAKNQNLELLTTFDEYNQVTDYRVVSLKCNNGHTFQRSVDRISNTIGCPICKGNSNQSYGYVEKIKSTGWTHVNGDYVNKLSVLKAQCNNGHIITKQYKWFRDHQCPICNGKRVGDKEAYRIDVWQQIQQHCDETGQKLITTWDEFKINQATKAHILLSCKNGHERSTTYKILLNHGCGKCKSSEQTQQAGQPFINSSGLKLSISDKQIRVDEIFGFLKVKSIVDAKHIICECVCGSETVTTKYKLLTGNCKSCGCKKYEKPNHISSGTDALDTTLINNKLLENNYSRLSGAVQNESSRIEVKCLKCETIKTIAWRAYRDRCLQCVQKEQTRTAYQKVIEKLTNNNHICQTSFEEYFDKCKIEDKKNSLIKVDVKCSNGHLRQIAVGKIGSKFMCIECLKNKGGR